MGSHKPASHEGHAGEPAQVQPIDPLHDIDGKKTVLSVATFTIGVFLSMGLLATAFAYVLEQEHQVKIFDRETTELNALRAKEAAELTKAEDLGSGNQRISIDEAMRRLATK